MVSLPVLQEHHIPRKNKRVGHELERAALPQLERSINTCGSEMLRMTIAKGSQAIFALGSSGRSFAMPRDAQKICQASQRWSSTQVFESCRSTFLGADGASMFLDLLYNWVDKSLMKGSNIKSYRLG